MQKAGLAVCGLVLAWAAWAVLHDLGRAPLQRYDEGTYAQVVSESFERHDFLTFTYEHELWFEKPPLYFWLAGAATYVSGDTALGIRLPAALFAIAVVCMTMLLAHRLAGDYWLAALAGALLVATGPFVEGAREARLDMLVAFFILLACWAAFSKRYRLFGAAAGLAVLSKSVIGLFAFVPLLFVLPPLSTLYVPALIFVLIVLPWHIYEWALYGGEFWRQYIGYHVLARYQTNLFGRPDLQTDYAARLFDNAKPLMGALLLSVASLPLYIKDMDTAKRRQMLAVLCTLGAMALLFFSAQTRALSYLIPLYPLAALVASVSAHQLLKR